MTDTRTRTDLRRCGAQMFSVKPAVLLRALDKPRVDNSSAVVVAIGRIGLKPTLTWTIKWELEDRIGNAYPISLDGDQRVEYAKRGKYRLFVRLYIYL